MKQIKKASKNTAAKKTNKGTGPKPKKPADTLLNDLQRLTHLLQVHQIELEHQNQELRIAQQELEVSRNKYVNLFDFSPIPFLTLDLGGVITEINISASKIFGIDRRKLIGKHFITNIPLTERNIFTSFLKTVFASPVKHSCKVTVMNKEKRIISVQMEGLESVDELDSARKCQVALIVLTNSD